jgi:GT2 family glycosyltransferase
VIVPAYKGRATIAGCLKAILKASGRWRTEILVIESSGDGTVEFVRQSFPQVTVFASPVRLSAGGARNEGFRRARGTWLLCVDQDCLVPDDWIDRLVALLQQPGTGAAGGSIAVANPDNRSGWCVYYLEFLNHFPSSGAVRTDNFLIGANSAWHPQVARQIGFPDQTLGEDLLFSEAIRQQGLAVRYDATLTVHHHNREGWSEFTRYCRAMGDAAAVDQSRLGGLAISILRRLPLLAFGIPLIILPRIAMRLLGAPKGYLARYLLLLPCCVFGQLVWASSFRRRLIQARATEPAER